MKRKNPYFNYWGKSAKKSLQDETDCHLLVFHSLDVSAVGYQFLQKRPSLLNDLSQQTEIIPDLFHKWFCFMLALHDVGKFAESFQNLCPEILKDLQNKDSSRKYNSNYKHDSIGFHLWNKTDEGIKKTLQTEGLLPKGTGSSRYQCSSEHPLDIWMSAVTGHHGQPPKSCTNHRLHSDDFNNSDYKAVSLFLKDLIPILLPDKPVFPECDIQKTKIASWYIAGLSVICDWIGSNKKFFPYQKEPVNLNDYWKEACKKAESAVSTINILNTRPSKTRLKIKDLLDLDQNQKPSALQALISQLEILSSPHLFILEDVTGSGKTEAALLLAHKLMKAGQGRGLYFALPTMATSNAMYNRIKHSYRKMFDSTASLILSHSARDIVKEFTSSIPEVLETENHYKDQMPAGFHCKAWLADSRKKALLADVGVGTIDQALLAILPIRHQALRLLGLSNKILIVDEVHACDSYMNKLLCSLLSAHAQAGGSAILLSATLPKKQRHKFLRFWSKGRDKTQQFLSGLKTDGNVSPPVCFSTPLSEGIQLKNHHLKKSETADEPEISNPTSKEPKKTDYPLITCLNDSSFWEKAFTKGINTNREIVVKFFSKKDPIEKVLNSVVEKGLCACWIRNTVKDAISSYKDLKQQHPDWKINLFHARFALMDRLEIENNVIKHFGKKSGSSDRQGQILIATQTVEQSLDLDFDVLISDLAPIDLLIQRAGRLRRHIRDKEGNPIKGRDRRDVKQTIDLEKYPEEENPIEERDRRDGLPYLYVYSPEWVKSPDKNWYADFFKNAKNIYPNHGQLYLTAGLLKNSGCLKIPEDSRYLIEGVYGDAAKDKIPEALRRASMSAEEKQKHGENMAGWNTLSIKKGYIDSSDHWGDERETPTRLGDKMTTVYLALWENGELKPYYNRSDTVNHAWRLSSVSIRSSYIKMEAKNSKIPLECMDKCRKSLPAEGRWGVLLPLIPISGSKEDFQGFAKDYKNQELCWIYSKKMGLFLKKS